MILREWPDYRGRSVVLSESRWYSKILLGHPEMEVLLGHIEWCINRPDLAMLDAINPCRECYYLQHQTQSGRDLWIKTVVHFDDTVDRYYRSAIDHKIDGFIVTCYLTSRVKPKEVELWRPLI